ncbi:MAG: hypothetical protein Q9225_002188 [Loekoesia sp. 1 TL-2023]
MPQLRDITVHVTDVDGNDLEEWGVQNLRGNKVSAYIKSTTDMPFRVSIRPRIPYPDEQPLCEDGRRGMKREVSDDVYVKQEDSEDDMNGLPSSSRQRALNNRHLRNGKYLAYTRSYSRDDSSYRQSRRYHHSDEHPASSPIYKHRKSLEGIAPPFSFLATLYLDGRKKPERRIVVYLDPNDADFTHPRGEVKFRCRCVQAQDRSLKEQAWVFKDVGIETVFQKIALCDRTDDLQDSEDVLVNALNNSKLGGERVEAAEERGTIGQIVVELERVSLGKKYNERDYRAKHYEGDKDDVDMDGVNQDVAHHTGQVLSVLETLEPQPTRCIEFEPYVKGEGPWATFQFFYRSQEQLQKFNFPGFPQGPGIERKRNGRRLNTNLAMMTPLSIAHPLAPAPVSAKKSKLTFEERIKEGSAELEDIEVKYEFYDYRDLPDNVTRKSKGAASDSAKIPASTRTIRSTNKSQAKDSHASGIPSGVVAVKEKTRQRSGSIFITGASGSSSASPLPDDSPLSPPRSLSIQPPANSPTTGFYNPTADPRLSAPKGSQLDTFKTLSDTSLVLTKAAQSTGHGQLTPKSVIKDMNYRRSSYSSDPNDAEDERSDTAEDEGSEDSDKENMLLTDGDDAGLHKELKAVSLGTKRHRGEGMEELEEGEINEDEEVQIKKKMPPADHATTGPVALERKIREGKKKAALRSAKGEDQYEETMKRWNWEEKEAGWDNLDKFI